MLILFTSFILLIVVGFPIAFALGLSSILYLVVNDITLVIVPQKMYDGIDKFVLLCIPGFIFAGNIMNSGGITIRIIDFANSIMGHITGGLALTNIGSSMLFAGISGTALADTASIGSIMIPAMVEEGYDPAYSAAVTAASSTVGPIIPPSLPMIIVGTMTGLSVQKLFAAGAIPGLMLGVGMMVVSYIISKKKKYPKGERSTLHQIMRSFIKAFWALLMPILILYGILGGMFTPTEASIIAVAYALVIGLFVYREMKFKDIYGVMVNTLRTTTSIMVLVGFANLFGWILTSEQIPQTIVNAMLSVTDNKILIILMINLLLLFIGTFMETIAALIILFPILLNVAVSVGVDPIQFGVIAVLNLMIGLSTPPVGVCLFVASSIGRVSLLHLSKTILPFIAVNLVILLLISYIPIFSLYIPQLLYGK